MAQRVRRRQDDHRAARPSDSPLRHRREWQRQLALQKPRRRSHSPRSPRLRNPGQLRRGERYRQNPPLKGVKFERRLTLNVEIQAVNFLPRADIGFQVKKTDFTPGLIAPEMRPRGGLRASITDLIT